MQSCFAHLCAGRFVAALSQTPANAAKWHAPSSLRACQAYGIEPGTVLHRARQWMAGRILELDRSLIAFRCQLVHLLLPSALLLVVGTKRCTVSWKPFNSCALMVEHLQGAPGPFLFLFSCRLVPCTH